MFFLCIVPFDDSPIARTESSDDLEITVAVEVGGGGVVVVVRIAKSSIFDGFERFARFGVDDAQNAISTATIHR